MHAPFGLADLWAMVVRPNKVPLTRAVSEEKVDRWADRWSLLTALAW